MNPSQSMPNVYDWGYKAGGFLAHVASIDAAELLERVSRFPGLYKEWWLNLVASDPIHVLVETTLLLFILYFMVSRSQESWKTAERDKLTAKEEKELLMDWKMHGRQPLAPPVSPNHPSLVVHQINGRQMKIEHTNTSTGTTNKDKNDPSIQTVLNFATLDFLGRSAIDPTTGMSPLQPAARKALDQYGCGSCGPRGFYGTVDVHLDLEQQYSDFLGTDQSILYSDGASTCSSTVAAFCKRGDLVVIDEAIYEPLRTGVSLSRANVKIFAHNDMDDLRKVLEQVQQNDKKLNRKSNVQRRFIVVEGLYKNTGQIVPLDELVQLKHQFRYRLILDESHSFGVLGKTGRGVTELYGQEFQRDVEITTISLENAMGSVGGITTGSEEVVDHQRLSGSGYCFSASSPPFTATAAIASLEMLQTQPETLATLHANRHYLGTQLKQLCRDEMEDVLVVTSDERSPLVLLQVAPMRPFCTKSWRKPCTAVSPWSPRRRRNRPFASVSRRRIPMRIWIKPWPCSAKPLMPS